MGCTNSTPLFSKTPAVPMRSATGAEPVAEKSFFDASETTEVLSFSLSPASHQFETQTDGQPLTRDASPATLSPAGSHFKSLASGRRDMGSSSIQGTASLNNSAENSSGPLLLIQDDMDEFQEDRLLGQDDFQQLPVIPEAPGYTQAKGDVSSYQPHFHLSAPASPAQYPLSGPPSSNSNLPQLQSLSSPASTAQLQAPTVFGRGRTSHSRSSSNGIVDILSDSDDDEVPKFNLLSWKRFYKLHRRKSKDLLEFFWRNFSSRNFSIYCFSHKHQDEIFAGYQGENLINGLCFRLEALGLAKNLFCTMEVLFDYDQDSYKVVGLLVVPGQELPDPVARLLQTEDYYYAKADVEDSIVKMFLSCLLVGKSPAAPFTVVCGIDVQ